MWLCNSMCMCMHVLLTKSNHRSQEQLMCEKGKPSGSIACMEKIAASVLLKLVISSNERCHTTDAP